jgi:hypothetical protein
MRETGEAVSMMAQAFARHKHLGKLTTREFVGGRIDLCGNKVEAIVLQTALAQGFKAQLPTFGDVVEAHDTSVAAGSGSRMSSVKIQEQDRLMGGPRKIER